MLRIKKITHLSVACLHLQHCRVVRNGAHQTRGKHVSGGTNIKRILMPGSQSNAHRKHTLFRLQVKADRHNTSPDKLTLVFIQYLNTVLCCFHLVLHHNTIHETYLLFFTHVGFPWTPLPLHTIVVEIYFLLEIKENYKLLTTSTPTCSSNS